MGANKPKYTAEEVMDRLLAAEEGRGAYTAEVAKEELNEGEKEAVSKVEGKLAMLPGGRARLDILKPSASLVLSDGKKLFVELPEAKQVMRYDAKKLKQSGNFFLDLAASIRHYSSTSVRRLIPVGEGFDAGQVSALELQPLKPEKAGFERLRIWVAHDTWLVRQAQLAYAGTLSTVRFSSPKAYPPLAKGRKAEAGRPKADQFKYSPPKGWDVFDMDF